MELSLTLAALITFKFAQSRFESLTLKSKLKTSFIKIWYINLDIIIITIIIVINAGPSGRAV